MVDLIIYLNKFVFDINICILNSTYIIELHSLIPVIFENKLDLQSRLQLTLIVTCKI